MALLLLVLLVAVFWLLQTTSGSRWVWQRVTMAVPGELDAGSVDGALADGFVMTDVAYEHPSLSVTAASAELAVSFDVFPPAINVSRLKIEDVVVQRFEQPPPDEPAGAFELQSLTLPVELNINDLEISNLRVLNGIGEKLFAVDTAELAGTWHDSISVSSLHIDSSVGSVNGSGSLGLSEPYNANLSIVAVYPLQLDASTQIPLDITANAEGDLEQLQIIVSSEEPQVHVEGTLSQLTHDLAWDVRVTSPYLQWPLAGEPPDVQVQDVALETSGRLSDYEITGDGKIAVAAAEPLQFSLNASGDRDSLEVDALELNGALLNASSTGEFRWAEGIAITVDADIERLDPAMLTKEWPEDTPVSGTARAAWSADKVELTEVRLRVAETGQKVEATGLVDLDRGVVDLDLNWQNLEWPVASDTPRFRSAFGNVNVAGKPQSWTLEGRIAFATPELPQGVFELSGEGNKEELELTLHDSQVLGGTAKGNVHYNWHAGGRWSTQLTVNNIATGALAPAWPGRVNADITAEGQLEPMQVEIGITRLDGVIRGRPVEAEGGIRYANENLAAEQLRITSGESSLQANGSLQSEEGLDFSIAADSLADFWPAAAGSLEASGNASLAEDFPVLHMDLDARNIAWRDYRLAELTLSSRERGADTPLYVVARGQELAIGERQIEEFELRLAASRSRQQLELAASLDEKDVEIALAGQLENWRKPLESAWTGELQDLSFIAPEIIEYSLAEPAGLRLDANRVALDRACLVSRESSRICLAGTWQGSKNFDVQAELVAVPVDLLKLVLETELEFTQTLDGTLTASNAAGESLSAQAFVNISPGQIRNPVNSQLTMRTRKGVVNFDLSNGQLLSGRLNLPVSDSAAIDAEFSVVDVAMGSKSRVMGHLHVNLNDIGVATSIVPSIDAASGRLDVDISLAGTLARPLLSGDASLQNGSLKYTPLGLKLENIELQGRIRESKGIDIRSTFTAGEGQGKIYSSAESLGGLNEGAELSLTGENLTVIDLPQVNVVADMDLRLGVDEEGLSINGGILIPHARLSPTEITSTRVSESEDVVIVASTSDEAEEENGDAPPFAMQGRVELALGDDVVVDFDAAETRLSGSTDFEWNGPAMPIGHGEYKVTGKFEAYGQLLEITEGTIGYPGVPADNPILRIRAEREIYGNPRIRTAGVLVSGTASDPEIEVYTRPATSTERALTLLVTGSDFNYEQGVGAVDVGTYIAPDLYLSYGIGLFDRENVISVRYDIAKGFGIKATSGSRAEGIDLSYTFER